MKKLNLGCGINWKKYEDYEGLDIDNYGQKYAGNVLELLKTFKDKEYDEVMANHFLEHFDQDDLKIIFTEVYRILKPKGLFRISVPHKNRERAWDLTHKTFWNENTVKTLETMQGFGKWKVNELFVKRRNIHARLNKREEYAWDYLKQIEPRGERLYKIISPYIEDKHVILEMNCGFSPLYHYLKDHTYFGFDNNKECIVCLKENHPSGNWQLCKSKHYKVEVKPDVLLLLGVTDGTYNIDDQEQNMVLEKIVKEYLPEIVVIEYHKRVGNTKDIKDLLISSSYKVLVACSYDSGLSINRERDIIIFKYDK